MALEAGWPQLEEETFYEEEELKEEKDFLHESNN